MMSITARLASLESALNQCPRDGLEPCEHCGAPDHAIRFDGLRIVLIPNPAMDRDCENCGRAIDPYSRKPIVAPYIVKLIRTTSLNR